MDNTLFGSPPFLRLLCILCSLCALLVRFHNAQRRALRDARNRGVQGRQGTVLSVHHGPREPDSTSTWPRIAHLHILSVVGGRTDDVGRRDGRVVVLLRLGAALSALAYLGRQAHRRAAQGHALLYATERLRRGWISVLHAHKGLLGGAGRPRRPCCCCDVLAVAQRATG